MSLQLMVDVIKKAGEEGGMFDRWFGKGLLTGYVYDGQGQPIAGARVYVGAGLESTTAQSGKFLIPKLKGAYDISLELHGQCHENLEKVHIGPKEEAHAVIRLSQQHLQQQAQMPSIFDEEDEDDMPLPPMPSFYQHRQQGPTAVMKGETTPAILQEGQATQGQMRPLQLETRVEWEKESYEAEEDELSRGLLHFQIPDDFEVQTSRLATHLCFVLDVSGSMDTPDKYPYLLEAIEILGNNLQDNQWLSIVLFSSDAALVADCLDPQTLRQPGSAKKLLETVKGFHGTFCGTALAPGLSLAIQQLKRFQDVPGLVQRLYIMTDGQLQDAHACTRQNRELRELGCECMSYGLGLDFALGTMRNIMDGCYGASVKRLADTATVRETFHHLLRVGAKVAAQNAKVHIELAPNALPGDTFVYRPMRRHYPLDGNTTLPDMPIGLIETEREYIVAFEARLPGEGGSSFQVGEAHIQYDVGQEQLTEFVPLKVALSEEAGAINEEVAEVWQVLEAMRHDDTESIKSSLKARIKIAKKEKRYESEIASLERALDQVEHHGTLQGLNQQDMMAYDCDETSVAYSPIPSKYNP